jgi:putative hydrolase of the HAD superfamily
MILFLDLDDTLIPSTQAYDHGMRTLGIEPSDETYLRARAQVKALCPPGYPASRSRRLYFKRYLELAGQFSPLRHSEMVEVYENAVSSFVSKAWHDLGRPRLLKELRLRARKIGLVTNETLAAQVSKLRGLDPDWKLFDFMITSEEAGVEKPHPRIFERALELAAAHPTEVLMVGDNPKMDIEGARAMGFKAVLCTEFLRPKDLPPGPVLGKLDELPNHIDQLNSERSEF